MATKRGAKPDTLAALKAQLVQANKDREQAIAMADRAKAEQAQSEKASMERERKHREQIKVLELEGNQLRDMVRAGEIELSRRAGYMQAVEDAKPPRLVEVPRGNGHTDAQAYEPHNGAMISYQSDDNFGYRETTRKPWWHR